MLSRASGTRPGIDLRRDAARSRQTSCWRIETCLYGLYAVPRLHFVQEPENYFALTEQLETTGRGSPARGAPLLAEVVRVTRCARRGLHCWPHFPNQVSTLDIARARGSIECGQAGGAVAPAHRDRTQPALKAIRNTATPRPTAAWAISGARIENLCAAVRSRSDGWVLRDQLAFLAWSKRSRTTFPASRKVLESLRI
jgi:hypothetical protein